MSATALTRGALAGAIAWWVMDGALRFLYNHEGAEVRRRESRARGGVPALEVMAQRLAASAGVDLSDRARQRAGTALQWG